MQAALHAYLRSDSGLALLRRCAVAVRRWMKDNGIAGSVAGCDSLDDLAGEIMVFILEREGLRQELEEAAASGNASALRNLIVVSFQRRVLDLRRAGRGDSWHALYRKIVRLLCDHPEFTTFGDKEGTWYEPQNVGNPETLNRVVLQPDHDLLHWPTPHWDHHAALERNISGAASEFWALVCEKNGHTGLVAVRDLVGWLTGKGLVDVRNKEAVLESDLPESGPRSLEEMAVASLPDAPLDREALFRLARRIVALWKPEMALAFHLVHGEGLKQAEAAAAMGYASASGVNYLLRQALLNLREMVSGWPELFGDEENERHQEAFLDCILAECKGRA